MIYETDSEYICDCSEIPIKLKNQKTTVLIKAVMHEKQDNWSFPTKTNYLIPRSVVGEMHLLFTGDTETEMRKII